MTITPLQPDERAEEIFRALLPAIKKWVEVVGGCLLWTGRPTKDGYGQLRRGKNVVFAHRAVYENIIGPIPKGKRLVNACPARRKLCVHPEHHVLSGKEKG